MAPLSDYPTETPKVCRNCGATLTGPYCSACGQEDRERIVSFQRFAAEQLHDFFSFDTRFFHTLGWLLRRPGFLTNEYVAGRRVRYMAPLRLYLIISFLFFFTITLLQVDMSGVIYMNPEEEAALGDSVSTVSAAVDTTQTAGPDSTALSLSEEEQPSAYQRSWLKRRLTEGAQKLREDEAKFEQDLTRRIPSMMFFLLPAFALLLKLLYVRRGILYAKHFVFSLHIHALAFLAFLLLVLLASAGVTEWFSITGISADVLSIAFLIGLAAYLFQAMRRVYEQSWIKTLIKLILLILLYIIIFSIAFSITAVITLLLF